MGVAAAYAGRTVHVLELAARGPVSAAGAADALGVDVRTARRLLDRLAAERVLLRRRGRGARYTPGPRLLELAADVILARPAPARAPA
jgi:DNA-binding IclR family transcriptional regulator